MAENKQNSQSKTNKQTMTRNRTKGTNLEEKEK